MTKDEAVECRSFAEGELKFDTLTAALTYFGKKYRIERQDPSHIDPSLDETIKKFLLGLT
jgi:hypothetical protein